MNLRIRELLKQAGVTDNWNKADWYSMSPEMIEKFAELLVQECIAQCEQVATDTDTMTKSKFVTDAGQQLHQGMWGGAKNCIGQIKAHFGVES
jgi:hypothetical protein